MVQKWLKIVNKSNRKDAVLHAIDKILKNDFEGLDIVQLRDKKGYYRCRIGNIRIIFFEKNGEFLVDKVGYRGDIY